MTTRRMLVSGRVQGVGFRWFVRREADRLGLRGYVRNLRDGRVEVLATGYPDDLEKLESIVRRGPPGARVTNLETSEIQEQVGVPSSFQIVH